MPESDETYIKNEINEISKTITAILKKVEQEREKFLPASTEDNPSESQNLPAKDDLKEESSSPNIETPGEPPEI